MQQCLFIVVFLSFISVALTCAHFQNTYQNIFLQIPHIAGLILARGGSKGIILKNLRTVGGQPLLKRALYQASKANFDSLWVSTDHYSIFEEANKFNNVNIHWRSIETATDEASSLIAVKEFLNKHKEIDVVAVIQCTSPFLKKEYFLKAKRLLSYFSCVFSVSKSSKLLWQGTSGNLFPVNFNIEKRPRRQELQSQFVENGMFYFANRKLIEDGYFQSHR